MTSFKLVRQEVAELRLNLGVLILKCITSLFVMST